MSAATFVTVGRPYSWNLALFAVVRAMQRERINGLAKGPPEGEEAMALIVDGRSFVVLLDEPQEGFEMPTVLAQEVTMRDAVLAAAAILSPVLMAQPNLGEKTIRALVAVGDPTICDGCLLQEECAVDMDMGVDDAVSDEECH